MLVTATVFCLVSVSPAADRRLARRTTDRKTERTVRGSQMAEGKKFPQIITVDMRYSTKIHAIVFSGTIKEEGGSARQVMLTYIEPSKIVRHLMLVKNGVGNYITTTSLLPSWTQYSTFLLAENRKHWKKPTLHLCLGNMHSSKHASKVRIRYTPLFNALVDAWYHEHVRPEIKGTGSACAEVMARRGDGHLAGDFVEVMSEFIDQQGLGTKFTAFLAKRWGDYE